MQHPHLSTRRRKRRGLAKTVSVSVTASLAAVTLALSGAVANADPAPSPSPANPETPVSAPPASPETPAPAPPADPETPPPPAPREPGRVDNAAGGLSYVVPAGWQVSENTNLSYGQALLTKIPPPNAPPGPSDTSVLLGRLDLKLFAGAEADDAKAAARLGSDMGEFFLPYAGTRINQAAGPLDAAGVPGAFSSYDVKFTDTTKPDGQIWAGVVGSTPAAGTPRGQRTPQRWFVVWLGSANNPVDKDAAKVLAESIRPFTPPPPPPPPEPDPNAPPPDPNAPKPRAGVGVPVPVTDAPPEMVPGG